MTIIKTENPMESMPHNTHRTKTKPKDTYKTLLTVGERERERERGW
jgi:hypothetical protein